MFQSTQYVAQVRVDEHESCFVYYLDYGIGQIGFTPIDPSQEVGHGTEYQLIAVAMAKLETIAAVADNHENNKINSNRQKCYHVIFA